MRAQRRNPVNYWLRFGVAAWAGVYLVLFARWREAGARGQSTFIDLNALGFLVIWIVVPLLTVDCLSRERREGTLGLLLLTPLTPREVVLAKALVHYLRGVTMAAALIPTMMVPLLAGGINMQDIVDALLINAGALLLALSAGLVASAYSAYWHRAAIAAATLSALLATGCVFLFHNLLTGIAKPPAVFLVVPPVFSWRIVPEPVRGLWTAVLQTRVVGADTASRCIFAIGVFAFLLALSLAGRAIAHDAPANPPTNLQLRLQEWVCAPRFFQNWRRRKTERLLRQNPMAWLQEYSWSSRVIKWGLCALVLGVDTMLAIHFSGGVYNSTRILSVQEDLARLVLLCAALGAVQSFRQERRTGLWELILVSDLKPRQILWGRCYGVLAQYLPAVFIITLMFWLNYYEQLWHAPIYSRIPVWNCWLSIQSGPLLFAGQLMLSLVCSCLIGIWLSLGRTAPVLAWVANVALSCGLPFFLAGVSAGPDPQQKTLIVRAMLFQCALAGLFGWQAVRRLAIRDWALPRSNVFVVVR